tara:strand:+ start:423 stop:1223 length:801 start_codon:yes stop_codon:yes gene_type:complete
MPASSKAQQRLMGLVKAVQAGDIPKSKVTKKIKQLAKNMKQKDVKKYAATKHKNLPDKVSVDEDGRAIMKSISNAKKGAVAKGGGYAPFVKMGKNSWKQAKTSTKTHDDGLFDKIGGFKDFIVEACWDGYKQVGMKKGKKGKQVPNCVPEVVEHCGCEHKDTYDVFSEATGLGYTLSFCTDKNLKEAEYQGRKVKLNKPMQGDVGKFKVYVKNDKGNVVKVNFGAKGSENRIKKSDPARRKSFRARHNCDSPGPKHKARYWSCRKW